MLIEEMKATLEKCERIFDLIGQINEILNEASGQNVPASEDVEQEPEDETAEAEKKLTPCCQSKGRHRKNCPEKLAIPKQEKNKDVKGNSYYCRTCLKSFTSELDYIDVVCEHCGSTSVSPSK